MKEISTSAHGHRFTQHVADLLARKYERVQIDMPLGRIDADVSFEFFQFGKFKKAAVEIKDYSKSLMRDDVATIYNRYAEFIQRGTISELIIITKNGLSRDASKYVSNIGSVSHLTIKELEAEISTDDEVVEVDPKSASYESLMENLEQLIYQIRHNNELRAASTTGLDRIEAELKATQELLRPGTVRAGPMAKILVPALKWLAEKGGTGVVSVLAKALLIALADIFGYSILGA